MRLETLHLPHYKNLDNFTVEFESDDPITVLVGQNGTGKSNLLEALLEIFKHLDIDPANPPFAYRLSYSHSDAQIVVDADPKRAQGRARIEVGGSSLSIRTFSQQAKNLLPRFVFGYYSGALARFEEHFDLHQKKFYDAVIDGQDRPLRPFFLARPFHSQFVLLAFFADPDDSLAALLRDKLGIQAITRVELVLREPYWYSKRTNDPFWTSRGIPRALIERLYELSAPPIRDKRSMRVDFRRSKTVEHIALMFEDFRDLRELALGPSYGNRQEFFKALESLVISDLLADLRIYVRISTDEEVEFRELSEGEQQLLTVLGLLRFTQEQQSLLLLDEPDTHLNPQWSREYVELLRKVMSETPTSQIVMATHDPLVVSGLTRKQVLVFERNENGAVSAKHPDRDPQGMGIAGLLTSEIYGLRSQLDQVTLEKLDEKRMLATLENRTPEQDQRLDELESAIGDIDLAASVRDPLYRSFVAAYSARQPQHVRSPGLTPEQIDIRDALVDEVLDEVLSAGESDS